MNSKLKELSVEEMELINGGLEQPQLFKFDENGNVVAFNPNNN